MTPEKPQVCTSSGVMIADIGVALLEDAVFGQQPVQIVQHPGEMVGPGVDVIQQLRRQVLMHAAGPEIGRVQTRAAGPLIKHHQLFTLFEPPQRRGQGADVQRLRGGVQQVVQDAPDLAEQHPDQRWRGAAPRAGQPLNRQTPGMFLVHRRHIVQPVEIRQVLQIGPAFHQLFGAAVQQGRYAGRNVRRSRRPAPAPDAKRHALQGVAGRS